MGSAIIGGTRNKYSVCVCEKDAKRRVYLRKHAGVAVTDLETLMKRSRVLILAVKPQDFEKTLRDIKQYVNKRHLVISIAAGITTKYIEKRLGKARIIRAMPNLGVKVGRGMTGIARGKYATAADMHAANAIFKNVGEVLNVAEDKLDAITAVSGSGPAYYFNFIEAFTDSAKQLGLSHKEALLCVQATLAGSSVLYNESDQDAAALRKQVTSKGGTTEAALKVLAKKSYNKIFSQALKAAKKRSKELSR
jgi:pyrroline-5-carboxylate reductase